MNPLFRRATCVSISLAVICSASAQMIAPLTSAKAVRALSPEEAGKALPVKLQAIVTFSEMARGATFIDDGGDGVFVAFAPPPAGSLPLVPGARVEIDAFTHRGHFVPRLTGPASGLIVPKILSLGELPPARVLTGAQLADPGEDCRWASIEAQVRDVFVADDSITLECFADPITFHAILAGSAASMETPWHLAESRVRLRGVVATVFNRHRQMIRRSVRVSTLADIEILQAATPPNSVPRPVLVDDIFKVNGPGPAELVRLRGVATLVIPGRGLFLGTQRGAIWVQSGQPLALSGPSEVEVEGWPRLGPLRPFLRARQIQVLAPAPQPIPKQLSAKSARGARYDAELVSIEATLLDHGREGRGVTLELRDDETVFRAHLARNAGSMRSLSPGVRVRVTGIAQSASSQPFSPAQQPDALLVQLRTPEDLVVLAMPSAWTTQNLLVVAAVALGALAAGYGISRARRAQERATQRREFEAVLTERGRMARDMHDSLAQGFTSISLQLECIRDEIDRNPRRAEEHVQVARGLVRDSLREARNSVWNLRSNALDEADLAGALRLAAAHLTDRTKTSCTVDIEGTQRPLPPDHLAALLRIGQEALTNAVRHGAARKIAVRLRYEPEWVTLSVRDDGCGFEVARAASTGFGLRGMHERVAALAGSVAIDSQMAAGTEVSATLPV